MTEMMIVHPLVDVVEANLARDMYLTDELIRERGMKHAKLKQKQDEEFMVLEPDTKLADGTIGQPGDYVSLAQLGGSMLNATTLQRRGYINIADDATLDMRRESKDAEYLWARSITTAEGIKEPHTKACHTQLIRPPEDIRNPRTGAVEVVDTHNEEWAKEQFELNKSKGLVYRNPARATKKAKAS